MREAGFLAYGTLIPFFGWFTQPRTNFMVVVMD